MVLFCQIRVYDFLVQYKSISEEDMGILRYVYIYIIYICIIDIHMYIIYI